jgi:hypothetical protein
MKMIRFSESMGDDQGGEEPRGSRVKEKGSVKAEEVHRV